jgi:hypothetical protein
LRKSFDCFDTLIENFMLPKGASCVFPNQPTKKFFLKVEFKKQGI